MKYWLLWMQKTVLQSMKSQHMYNCSFLFVSLLQLMITVLFQAFVMRDLEKLAGSMRIAIIYITSGIAGSLSSAIFLPYHVEVITKSVSLYI